MDVLKIATAGSVDDGKSTLIGRLLYDTQSLTDDKLDAIKRNSQLRGYDYLDFSLATDGLVAEREQGITIDVAHIYFSTEQKSYIIADTPGHVEYTRNMVTGASTSQASIILIDARKGVIEQTYRHFFINNLLRVKNVIVAVNKMDLVGYSETVFNQIKNDFEELNRKSSFSEQQITFIPISALKGDNVVGHSSKMPWYNGESILENLEKLDATSITETSQARFPVQTVIRPKSEAFHDFRGYAGKVYGNQLSVNDEVTILPSLKKSKIKSIHFFDQELEVAEVESSVVITLADDVNVSRGDMLVKSDELPKIEKELDAIICWMDNKELSQGAKYILQHSNNNVLAKVDSIDNTIATDFGGKEDANGQLKLNEIGQVKLRLNKPIYFDAYEKNKNNGAFILIDSQTHATAGVGFLNNGKVA